MKTFFFLLWVALKHISSHLKMPVWFMYAGGALLSCPFYVSIQHRWVTLLGSVLKFYSQVWIYFLRLLFNVFLGHTAEESFYISEAFSSIYFFDSHPEIYFRPPLCPPLPGCHASINLWLLLCEMILEICSSVSSCKGVNVNSLGKKTKDKWRKKESSEHLNK
jgi:hypothetical protein